MLLLIVNTEHHALYFQRIPFISVLTLILLEAKQGRHGTQNKRNE